MKKHSYKKPESCYQYKYIHIIDNILMDPYNDINKFGPNGSFFNDLIKLQSKYDLPMDYINDVHMMYFQRKFSFTCPTKSIIKSMIKFIDGGSVLEICGGLGLWSKLLYDGGIKDIVCTDSMKYYESVKYKPKFHTTVIKLDYKIAIKKYPSNVLFTCWPEANCNIGTNSIKLFKGDKIIFIGRKSCIDKYNNLINIVYKDKGYKIIDKLSLPIWKYDPIKNRDSVVFYSKI